MIELKHVGKSFSTKNGNITVLKDINLKIEDGDVFGIIGLSGAGKSTLVRCINYLGKPTEGQVIVDGEDLGAVSEKRLLEIRRNVSMIFQQFNLLQQRTVLKNVELAGEISNDEKRKEKAIKLLESVGLGNKLDSYPAELSGGQQQRVAIARALMSNPKYLLCDEATSALDPETTHSILELLKKLNKKLGLTIVIISHQMSVIEAVCNKVAIIDHAEISSCGEVQDVFLSPKTEIEKKLIYSGHINSGIKDEKLIKIMFKEEIDTPIITNIIQECNILVSILYAESKVINGKTYGQVIFRLPYYEEDVKKLCDYLKGKGVSYEEVNSNDLY